MLAGFGELVPVRWIRMFSPAELSMLIGGKDPGVGFDVDDLRRHARYSGGYHPDQPYVQAFWRVVASFNKHQRADLLRFVTSCSRPV